MGLSQSRTAATEVVPSSVANISFVPVETPIVPEKVKEPVIESVVEQEKLSTIIEETKTEINTTPVTTPVTTPASEVFSRYVTPPGTKVEVAPVDVAPAADVVKKNKNKNKRKNNDITAKKD
jgi:hypothetical protein